VESFESTTKTEPFAGYNSFEECVKDNADKDDPDGYCASIMRDVEDSYWGEGLFKESIEESLNKARENVDLTPPSGAVENAEMALEMRENHPETAGKCGGENGQGWRTAQQLVENNELTPSRVGRMASFARHEDNSEVDEDKERHEDCGYVMWKAWGGDEGVEWAQRKTEELEQSAEENLKTLLSSNKDMTDNSEKNEGGKQSEKQEIGDVLTENFENVTREDIYDLVASHFEGVGVEDVAEMLDESEFTGFDVRELASLIAGVYDVDTGTVLQGLESLVDQLGEKMQDDEDDEEKEEGKQSEEAEEEKQDESMDLVKRLEKLEGRLEEKEKKIEALQADAESKQPSETTVEEKRSGSYKEDSDYDAIAEAIEEQ
jgi:hypothetical protein